MHNNKKWGLADELRTDSPEHQQNDAGSNCGDDSAG